MRFIDCLRISYNKGSRGLPYSISFDNEMYWKYISRFRNDIPSLLGVDYTLYNHEHEDWYVHTTTIEKAKKILRTGYLDRDMAREDGSVGYAIYTFPAKSGRCYIPEDSAVLLFKSNMPHYHIVGANESTHCLGECIFTQSKLPVRNCQMLSSNGYKDYIQDNFDWEESLTHYFGIPKIEIKESKLHNVNVTDLKKVTDKIWRNTCLGREFFDALEKDFPGDNSLYETSLF